MYHYSRTDKIDLQTYKAMDFKNTQIKQRG